MRATNYGDNTTPSIVVPGAFSGGGAQVGNSGAITTSLELNSSTSFGYHTHTFRWGGRLREGLVNNRSVNNFGGTYTFQGGSGPALDANGQPIPGTQVDLTALDVYQRTLLFQQQGLNDAAIRALGGGAYQFSLAAGQPIIHVNQFDAGLFVVDDWRANPTLTFSYGLRFEAQSNIGHSTDWAPRIALAKNIGTKNGKPGKTVIRAGVGAFYNRVPLGTTLNALRFNGVEQQAFVVSDPVFFPAIPSVTTLRRRPPTAANPSRGCASASQPDVAGVVLARTVRSANLFGSASATGKAEAIICSGCETSTRPSMDCFLSEIRRSAC